MDFNLPLTPAILKQVARIDQFRGTWAAGSLLPPERLNRMRETAHLQSTAAACRMAGIRVTDADVQAVLEGRPNDIREAHELRGYAEGRRVRFPSRAPIVTTEEIRSLHAVMLGRADAASEATPWREGAKH